MQLFPLNGSNWAATVGLAFLLAAATACDISTFGKPSGEVPEAAPAASDESAPPTPEAVVWLWPEASSRGWSVSASEPETYSPETGGLGFRANADPEKVDVFLRSPKLDIEGANYTKILVDLECVVAAEQNDLSIYYITASHGESPNFRAHPQNKTPLAAGERRVLEYDLTKLSKGGSDWVDSRIQRIRFDLPQGVGSEYVLHSLKLCSASDTGCK